MQSTCLRALPWLMLLLLTACAGQPPLTDTTQDWDSQRAALAAMDAWTLRGKLALRTTDRSESASVIWQQSGSNVDLRLSGPLGAGATRVSSNGRQLVVSQNGKADTFDISTPDAVAASTGWNLPVKALPYWVRGLPAPEPAPSMTTIDAGLMQRFEQAGWQVHYERYQNVDGHRLPAKIAIENGDTRARLVIRSWELPKTQ